MKKQKYLITFIEGNDLIIYADSPNKALFLASARMIDNGQPYGVDSILEYDTNRFFISKRENLQNLLRQV